MSPVTLRAVRDSDCGWTWGRNRAGEREVVRVVGICSAAIRQALPNCSIIAVGSAGRGELLLESNGPTWEWLSDLELVVVLDGPYQRIALGRARSSLVRRVDLPNVTIIPVGRRRLRDLTGSAYARPGCRWISLEMLDLALVGRMVAGRPPEVPPIGDRLVPPWEFERLCINRVAEVAAECQKVGRKPTDRRVLASISKLVFAVGDIFTWVLGGEYEPRYAAKRARLRECAAGKVDVGGLLEVMSWAERVKGGGSVEAWTSELDEGLQRSIGEVGDVGGGLLTRWEGDSPPFDQAYTMGRYCGYSARVGRLVSDLRVLVKLGFTERAAVAGAMQRIWVAYRTGSGETKERMAKVSSRDLEIWNVGAL